jgi:phosphatidylglycerol lysyltransferase
MSRQFDAFYCDGVDGYLAYAMVDRTAMMVGDPVADKPDAILAEFVNWCDRQNHRVCALQIGHATATALRALGCCVNKIGIETSVDVRRFDLDLRGKEYQEIRNSRNVAQRLNITVREQPLAERSRAELQSLFADWLDRKKNKQELHLLLRPPSLAPEPSVRHFLAEYQGRLIAAVFFTPIYCDGRATGYYADIERYNNNNNIPTRLNWMKLIQFEAAKTFQQEGGVERIALGMSPLSCVGESEFNDNPELTALFEQLFEESELYAFKGIATHKRRYPCLDEHPVYIATRTPTAADEILDLLKGVGLLGENGAQQSASLVREARGGPRDGEP